VPGALFKEVKMAKDFDNTNSGAMFKNKNKDTETKPDRKGSITIECPHCHVKTDYWANGWINTSGPQSKNPGEQYMSLRFTPKEEEGGGRRSSSSQDNFDDDIPF
jgi:hypothetical protein